MKNFKKVNPKQSSLKLEEELLKFKKFIILFVNKRILNTILDFLKWFKLELITFNKESCNKYPKE